MVFEHARQQHKVCFVIQFMFQLFYLDFLFNLLCFLQLLFFNGIEFLYLQVVLELRMQLSLCWLQAMNVVIQHVPHQKN